MNSIPLSLLETAALTVASNVSSYSSLDRVPEDLLLYIFTAVLQQGKLTPKVLRLFKESGRTAVIEQIKALGVKDDLPPVIRDSRNPWLGDKPSLF
ncbi:hypothetical protein CHLRE_12g484300v5 [Chlamydomonas reinhardtii]|uniref:Uncharacterized protein n=1 Tax=Chlamydomonas reinhardtii TaxID=3055 RepID=A8JHU8_CHLRE|nr:uncharacterized protein CHLRE_12g484300v5 [Chlamydomonas reinhardtii]PNW74445.1 hypothetical protein CHLRE_12g484300v5 [Chlamydomonas reinhardtii]|eukprot:XP_001703171.1 predicted protein [Chlamydomonas reinhardtii]